MRTSDLGASCRRRLHRELAAYVDGVVSFDDSRQIQLLGTGAVAELEAKLCGLVGMRYAVCVSSATAGLMITALALGLQKTRFIAPPLGYGGALAGWLALGHQPVFADVEPECLGLDPDAVRRRARRTAGIGAVLAIDFHGVPSDTAGLRQVADDLGLPYVADAAESLGARVAGEHASARADVVVTSFTSGKTVFAGEGGAVLTNDRQIYERLLRHGQHPYRQRFQVGLRTWNECSVNARMHPLAAIWANATFDAALARAASLRRHARRAVMALAVEGLVEPAQWARSDLEPAPFRASAILAPGANEGVVHAHVAERSACLVRDAPLGLLTSRPEIRAITDSRVTCDVARQQAARRLVWRVAWRGQPRLHRRPTSPPDK